MVPKKIQPMLPGIFIFLDKALPICYRLAFCQFCHFYKSY